MLLKSAITVSALAGIASLSLADIQGNAFTLTANTATGLTAQWTVSEEEGTWNGDTWSYTAPGPITLRAGESTVATLEDVVLTYVQDPVIGMAFTVSSLLPTNFVINSGVLNFAPIANPTVSSSAGVTLTDNDGAGASITGNQFNNVYQARYNGGNIWANHVASYGVGAFATDTRNDSLAGGLVVPVSSMQVGYSFDLAAGDSMSTTSVFVVIPAPGAAALAGLAAVATFRRRR